MEHGAIAHRPYLALCAARAVHQHGMALVHAARDVGVAAGAEDRRGAGVRVHAGEVVRGQREASFRVGNGSGVVQEEGAARLGERAVRAAADQRAEFERGVHVLEEDFPILEVEQTGNAPARGDGLEEGCRGLVGVDA